MDHRDRIARLDALHDELRFRAVVEHDMTVRNQKGEVIAEMRGTSRTIKGIHIEEIDHG